MVFGRKKEMIDLSEVQKRSVNLPHGRKFIPKDGYGFVDLTKKPKLPLKALETPPINATKNNNVSFSFFDTPPSNENTSNNSNNDESLRKISMQISELDSKLYKLEQRIELLERKTGISNSDSSSSPGFNW